jgi:hypothetical protein
MTSFSVEQDPDNAKQAVVHFAIAFRCFTATYTLVGVSPS